MLKINNLADVFLEILNIRYVFAMKNAAKCKLFGLS